MSQSTSLIHQEVLSELEPVELLPTVVLLTAIMQVQIIIIFIVQLQKHLTTN